MLRSSLFLSLVALVLTTACETGPHASTGFRLPPDGDAERGREAFVSLKCVNCHDVINANLPRVTITQTKAPVILGGEVRDYISDGYFVTSIINPDYKVRRFPEPRLPDGSEIRMPRHDDITVRQLTDIVSFLQSNYRIRQPVPYAD